MSKGVLHRTAIALAAIAVVASGVAFALRRPAPFDEAYWECWEEEAEWKLAVTYTIDGVYGEHEMDVYFHPRPVQSHTWDAWFRSNQTVLIEPVFSHGGWTARACSLDGTGYSEHCNADPAKTSDGVNVKVVFTREGSTRDMVINETFAVPFSKTVNGKKGKVAYRAAWHRCSQVASTASE